MWFDITWNSLFQSLVPSWWRKPRTVALLRTAINPVRQLDDELVAERNRLVYEMSFTGQTMSLEAALNDRFDDLNRGIYIENIGDPTLLFIHRKEEAAAPLYIYRKWLITTFFGVGQFCVYNGRVWKCLVVNVGVPPVAGNFHWEDHGTPVYLRRKEEVQIPWNFIVWVPSTVVFDMAEMRALVDRYRIASKRYTVKIIP